MAFWGDEHPGTPIYCNMAIDLMTLGYVRLCRTRVSICVVQKDTKKQQQQEDSGEDWPTQSN